MGTAERKNRERIARRSQILDAAREVFFSKGLTAATVDEIAEKAELSKGTIYLYFKSKEEIYVSLMHEGVDILLGYLRKAVRPNLSSDELLSKLKDAYYRFYVDCRKYFTILFLYFHTDIREKLSRELIQACELKAKEFLQIIADTVKKGIENKEFRRCDPWQAVLVGWAMFNGVIMLAEQDKHHPKTFGFNVKQLLNVAQDLFIQGLKNPR